MRVRIKFEKTGVNKYVGHLDLMRFFQKAVKRANLPIRYSEGYNPHQIMSFAAPLGVGVTSVGEYMDIDIKEDLPSKKAIEALNANMVDGIVIKSFRYLSDDAEKCMTAVSAASYRVLYKYTDDEANFVKNLPELKSAFFDNAASILVTKETKKGSRDIDLKPLIYQFDLGYEEGSYVYNLCLSSGSTDNIKPELVISAFHKYVGLPDCDRITLDIMRLDMFTGPADALVSLGDLGDEH